MRRENLHRLIDDQTEAIRRTELSRKKVREMEIKPFSLSKFFPFNFLIYKESRS